MNEMIETAHGAPFLISARSLSRENVLLAKGENLKAGHVLGKITIETVTGAADPGNVGNGALWVGNPNAGAKAGIYTLTCTGLQDYNGQAPFAFKDPDGILINTVYSRDQYAGVIDFILDVGPIAFAVSDKYTLTVTGSGKYRSFNPANIDGSSVALAVLLADVDASEADAEAPIIVRQTEIRKTELAWFDGATDAQKTVALEQLKKQTILAR